MGRADVESHGNFNFTHALNVGANRKASGLLFV